MCCAAGTSCAPTVVMYYLMRHASFSLAAALNLVSERHPPSQPNIGFIQRLTEAEAWMTGAITPTLSIEEYKWRFLQRAFPQAGSPLAFFPDAQPHHTTLPPIHVAARA